MTRWYLIYCVLIAASLMASVSGDVHVHAATGFADPRFRTTYVTDEAIVTNFWGPLATATEPLIQMYNGHERNVQYFDKGRMELTNGQLTLGLLATEMVTARIQTGDKDFAPAMPSTTPIAGDDKGGGPSYATINEHRDKLLNSSPNRAGQLPAYYFNSSDQLTNGASVYGDDTYRLTRYDSVTKHNLIEPFAQYRDKVGFSAVGYAISEPFGATFSVGGKKRGIGVQVFERRVLTYSLDNSPNFRVEMGNIGQHYYRWRHTIAGQG